ncbi:hypothetical protein Hanom_Chr15g01358021 [Helianthus anomalus]
MGIVRELGRGLGTNAHLTILGGLGFGCGPLGGGFCPGVGRGYETDMAGSDWLGWLGFSWLGFFLILCVFFSFRFFFNTPDQGATPVSHASPYPTDTSLTSEGLELHVSTHAPNPRPTTPTVLF